METSSKKGSAIPDKIKEYLEIACLSGFDDKQIVDDVNALFGSRISSVPETWKAFMKDFIEGYNAYIERCAKEPKPIV